MNKMINYEQTALLQLRTGHDYEAFGFDDAYFNQLASFMGLDAETLDWEAFLSDHFNLLYGYLQSVALEENQTSITAENKALEKIRKLAGDLTEKLQDIHSVGSAGARLFDEINRFPASSDDPENRNIRMLLGDPAFAPFEEIVIFLNQLQVGLERAKIKQPKPHDQRPPSADVQANYRSHRERILRDFANATDTPSETYQKRQADYNLRTNHALMSFTELFEDMWHEYSPLPFTEGKYEPDAHQHISATVDAAQHILGKLGSPDLRSLIEKKVREVREDRYKSE